MDEGEIEAQSFVVKVWLEETDSGSGRRLWRGRVTHVPTGEHHAFTELAALVGILEPYVVGNTPTRRHDHPADSCSRGGSASATPSSRDPLESDRGR